MTLNWRHKAGLFVAITATGLSLFFELSTKQTVGIAILGIAFAWFVGSVTIHALGLILAMVTCSFGLYIATAPLGNDWISIQESAADYDLAMQMLSSAVHNSPTYEVVPPRNIDYDALAKQAGAISSAPPKSQVSPLPPGYTLDRNVAIPKAVDKWIQPASIQTINFFDSVGRPVIDFPGKMSDEEIMAAFQKILLPRPRYIFSITIKEHLPRVLEGTVLFLGGLAGFVWLWRTRIKQLGPKQAT